MYGLHSSAILRHSGFLFPAWLLCIGAGLVLTVAAHWLLLRVHVMLAVLILSYPSLAADFATRAALHDRDASNPIENYERLRDEGFLALTVGREWGGAGVSFLDHTIAYEALGQGCPSTALAFNMHTGFKYDLVFYPRFCQALRDPYL